ncbi:HTH-type transcriptional regulator DmlR [Myxococcus stipitatus]
MSNNGAMLRTAILKGLGIGLMPWFIVGEDVKAGHLVPLLTEYEPLEVGIYAVYPQNRQPAAKVRSFVDFLATRFQQEPSWEPRGPPKRR